uniref:Uncharacterized protein n=1 Tax=Pinguiococcus pyrenoidosus TaxID=172671 RepID=A0A7R9UF75_9STRA
MLLARTTQRRPRADRSAAMSREALDACALERWYPYLRRHTLKTRFVQLSPVALSYLSEDGVTLPPKAEVSSMSTVSLRTSKACGNDSLAGHEQVAALVDELDEAISALGGAVFPKLRWSAPRDATWATAGSAKCLSAGDVLLLLKSSEIVLHELESQEDSETVSVAIGLRKWCSMRPCNDFRCFCAAGRVVGISQRDLGKSYSFLLDEDYRDRLLQTILSAFEHAILPSHAPPVQLERFVVDVYVTTEAKRVVVVDFSPWGEAAATDPLLFTWPELDGLAAGASAASELDLEHLRVVGETEQSGTILRNPFSEFRAPLETQLLQNGVSGVSFMDFMKMCKAGGYSDTESGEEEAEGQAGGEDADASAKQRIIKAATAILLTPDPFEKARLSSVVYGAWEDDQLQCTPGPLSEAFEAIGEQALQEPPVAPARPSAPDTDPDALRSKFRKIKLGNRKGLLHSIAHAESYAIDLMWDLIARFGSGMVVEGEEGARRLPIEFFNDFAEAAAEEARHFLAWCGRLEAIGAPYGSLPTHDGLWESAAQTADDLAARLVIVHCIHEARGLDTFQSTREKLQRCQDDESIRVLEQNVEEEVQHVRKGVSWLHWLADTRGMDARELFDRALTERFVGGLKPPFNLELRDRTRMPRSWYLKE